MVSLNVQNLIENLDPDFDSEHTFMRGVEALLESAVAVAVQGRNVLYAQAIERGQSERISMDRIRQLSHRGLLLLVSFALSDPDFTEDVRDFVDAYVERTRRF